MGINMQQAFELFIFDRETYCGENTVRNYKNTLGYFLRFLMRKYNCDLCKIDADSITNLDLQEYVIYLRNKTKLDDHPFKPTEDKHITNTTIRTYSIDLRTFFNFLFRNEYIEKDLMKKFKLIKREKKLVLPVFSDEVKTIDSCFNLRTMTGIRNYCIVHLMLDAGLRSGEVCKLHLNDINFLQNHIIVIDGKGKKDRIVPLAKKLKKCLHEYITLYRPYTGQEHDFLFCSVNGSLEPISGDTIKSLFSRIKKKTGLERLKPHLLRHTFATSFILGGGDMESLRLYMGHSGYDVTQDYLHLANTYSRMGSDIYKLDKIFFRSYYGGYGVS
ncbi:tyrosine-type recombinase/integrase [Lactonifactor sp. BIOML-A3]|uniref:tyrosine-type recombinase/integrase n=1 Tax=unclassified Lactonifactor TaxID=2636670 RepID=UPI0012AF29AB|nr:MULTISPECIES: tyrosine-type recombinase/integrase [unclassified Lactonifactor]MSA03713.1 tyrosine-type recombinase/integrase [Lactonifactor sp. BIOML-A5]MSA10170.1 tyrosine-type recombinase/integrase [Lactonifactor sp. BIOML-A4]MSA14720.1 tyrosine-type recombinase/integrase [Lactonifactor sp. BIOML-A3]MSA19142.1 tyrosine-type recombinase/integrase [Lactonifactor sp. BIOML-A2]MSA39816.1 tyrosine-type recombinase/integrase [Lactonifactor sp. BIOML-A1]